MRTVVCAEPSLLLQTPCDLLSVCTPQESREHRCERVDTTSWFAMFVALACSEIGLHLSALRFLVPSSVLAFTFQLAGRFLIFLLALASLLELAFAALATFAFV